MYSKRFYGTIFLYFFLFYSVKTQDDIPGPIELMLGMLHDVFARSYNTTKFQLSLICQENLEFILREENINYIQKFLLESANNKNDIENFIYCNRFRDSVQSHNETENLVVQNFYNNLTYAIIQIDKEHWVNRTDIRYVSGQYLLGICIIKNCSETDYEIFFSQMNEEMSNPLGLTSKSELSIFDMSNYEVSYNWMMLVNLIPFIILLIQLLFTCVPEIPAYLFSCCFFRTIKKVKGGQKKEENIFDRLKEDGDNKYTSFLSETEEEACSEEMSLDLDSKGNIDTSLTGKLKQMEKKQDSSNYDYSKKHEFILCYKLAENTEDFFTIKSSRGTNESGISNLRGLRGFSMLFMIIGHIYLYLLVSPLKIYSEFQHKALITATFYGIIQFGMRYAPRMLIACSGFTLVYKLLSYLDCIVELSDDPFEDSIAANGKLKTQKSMGTSLPRNDSPSRHLRKINREIKFSHLLKFLVYQGYKYFLFVIFVCYFKFSFYEIANLFYNPGPMWVYLKINIIDKMTNWDFIGTIFLFNPYSNSHVSSVNIFWLAENEITFFLLTTVVIFFSYKKNFRMDILFLLTFLILFSYKLIYYFFMSSPELYPILGNYTDGNANFYLSPLYNYTFFIIGLFFGLVNYVIQKSISKESVKSTGKTYLNFPICFLKMYENNRNLKVIIITVLGIIAALFLSMSYPILFTILGDDQPDNYLEKFNSSLSLNLFYLLDTELFILITFVVFTSLFILGDNFFVDFFTHDYWCFISRSYFSFILTCDMVIIYVFYQSESRIKLEIFSILFFSLFLVSSIIVVSISVHIVLEMPFKKLNKRMWACLDRQIKDETVLYSNSPEKFDRRRDTSTSINLQ